ncbi:MAG: hypothetical protein JWO44_2258 [Bacteroidetes bacterium]|nr:hypothetical protein [Bacteroidota bacterium]
MKQLLIMALLAAISLKLQAQETDRIKVKKVKWEVNITSPDSIFWIAKANPVVIDVKGGTNYAVNILGGTILKKGGKYFVDVKEEGAATISVYEKMPNKKLRVLFTRLFPVKKIPSPQFFVCGVKADSVIDKEQIISDNVVTAYHPFYKVNLPVTGFDVTFRSGGKTEMLSSQNNQFTIDMRRRIYSLKPGTLLTFRNVYYILPDGTREKMNEFEVFIAETNKYKVGYRVIGL